MASDDEGGLDLFQEPADFYEPEKEATFATHRLLSGKEFTVRLVGHNPLWVRLNYHSGFEAYQRPTPHHHPSRICVLEECHIRYYSKHYSCNQTFASPVTVNCYHGTHTDVHRDITYGMPDERFQIT